MPAYCSSLPERHLEVNWEATHVSDTVSSRWWLAEVLCLSRADLGLTSLPVRGTAQAEALELYLR